VTCGNCRLFIEKCHGFRISELERPLKAIREGLWENLGFDPPQFISGGLLMLLTSRKKVIDLKQLRDVIHFCGIDEDQQKMFWNTLDRMGHERQLFLRFATGNTSIPKRIVIDKLPYVDRAFPTACTCDFRFHMPVYSVLRRCMIRLSRRLGILGRLLDAFEKIGRECFSKCESLCEIVIESDSELKEIVLSVFQESEEWSELARRSDEEEG
jgi:hypothetical protein